ncbi:single-stranded DNA-binding protein [Nocardia sp. NPDC050175]|uniref:single-stranded DNA-binding protein n=1 Tax=Nocardia sp. NPDC050175 TaxID=3364317 RepID=UPI00378AB7FE
MQISNLTADPELRFTKSGTPVANVTVAQNTRVFDRETAQWKDGDAVFMRCNIWEFQAEHAAESLRQGMRVVVTGRLKQRSYDTRDGEKRYVTELIVDEIAPSLRYAIAKVARVDRNAVDPREPVAGSAAESSPDPADQLAAAGVGTDEAPF